jgi:hypothetical protein
VVTHDVPDHAFVAGNPARHKGWVCQCGERLEAGACPAGHVVAIPAPADVGALAP